MNETYKNLLDYYADPANSSNYKDLCYHLFSYAKANRDGEGFTPVEELQVDIFCNGICAVYQKIVQQKYDIDPSDAADALYEMMPASLKYYWW